MQINVPFDADKDLPNDIKARGLKYHSHHQTCRFSFLAERSSQKPASMFPDSLRKKQLLIARDYQSQQDPFMPFTRSMISQKEEYSGKEEADESISDEDEVEMEGETESGEGLDVYESISFGIWTKSVFWQNRHVCQKRRSCRFIM